MTRREGEPIGFVSYGKAVRAELWGEDDWRVLVGNEEVPELAETLTRYYRDSYQGPADGFYGQAILQHLAEMVDGKVTWLQKLPNDPLAIY